MPNVQNPFILRYQRKWDKRKTQSGSNMLNGPRRLTVAERDTQIMHMKIRGATCSQIGAQFGINAGTVTRSIQRHLATVSVPQVDEYRKLQDLRLDFMLNALWPKIEVGDVDAIQAALRLEDQRAKLFGTYARDTTSDESGRPAINIAIFRQMEESAQRARINLQESLTLPAPNPVTEQQIEDERNSYIEGIIINEDSE